MREVPGDPLGNARKWVIGSAWPYIYAVPHLGNLIGSVLSADVFARYLRLRGDDVVFVSGSDEHGTPIEVEALQLGVKPRELTDRMHEIIRRLFEEWEISFDNYTRTESPVHREFVKEFFMKLYNNGYVFTREDEVPYCPRDRIYLPDRFIIGTCPYCGYDKARGDQCENCGRLLEPRLLINPRCAICGSKPTWVKTKHWYLDLTKLEDKVRDYVINNNALPENAKQMSLGILKEGLKPRAITRDNKWGIEAPFPGAEGKTIYVWLEAVLGYISATIEYFRNKGSEERWKEYWFNNDTRVVFFVGKDNIPFHVILLPAMLMASGDPYVMPYTTASTEYLLYEGKKFSKSQRIGIWIDEALALMPVEYWRFVLIYQRPEGRDASFSWSTALELINSILNDVIGNFIHRVLTFIATRFDSKVPSGNLRDVDVNYINEALRHFKAVEEHYERIELRDALAEAVEIARVGNKYLNERQPWEVIKSSKDEAGAIINNALHMVKALSIALWPVMPRYMEELWNMANLGKPTWFDAYKPPEPGKAIGPVKPLFRKISHEEFKAFLKRLEEIRSMKDRAKYPWEEVYLPGREGVGK
ncbi:methionine--tRNA ligase [Vulcanisaeta thermophila]|uniref:methionine--tRNA ligase n=1 Tax=Vulcanisaeta thermophila TaxID=867917 RepID=UPI000852A869